jgi:hypothetical protein
MKKIIACLALVVLAASCADNSKKIIVMSKGPADINTDTKTIIAKDGAGHDEKTISISDKKVSFKLSTPAGDANVELLENGYYIINVKNDTIIGSYQQYTDPNLVKNVVTQEELKKKIDSLSSLVAGKNVSAANRNFFILPNTVVRISGNLDAIVVGPYHKMTSAEKVGDKDPEVYRFYSIREMREEIARLRSFTIAEKK